MSISTIRTRSGVGVEDVLCLKPILKAAEEGSEKVGGRSSERLGRRPSAR